MDAHLSGSDQMVAKLRLLGLTIVLMALPAAGDPGELRSAWRTIREKKGTTEAANALYNLYHNYEYHGNHERLLQMLVRDYPKTYAGLRARRDLLAQQPGSTEHFVAELDKLQREAGGASFEAVLPQATYPKPAPVSWLTPGQQREFLQYLPALASGVLYAQGQIQLAREYQAYALQFEKNHPSPENLHAVHPEISSPNTELLYPIATEDLGQDECFILEVSGNTESYLNSVALDQQPLPLQKKSKVTYGWSTAGNRPLYRREYKFPIPKGIAGGPHRLTVSARNHYGYLSKSAFPLMVVYRQTGDSLQQRFQNNDDQQNLEWFQQSPSRCWLQEFGPRQYWQDALSLAAKAKHWKTALWLAQRGVRPSTTSHKEDFWVAWREGPVELVRTLVDHEVEKSYPVARALYHQPFERELLELSLSRGGRPEFRDLNDLVSLNDPELWKLVLSYKPDLTQQDNDGKTVLHQCSNPTIAQMLIAAGCDPRHRDNRGFNAVQALGGEKAPKELLELYRPFGVEP
jgi:hypothetical protein